MPKFSSNYEIFGDQGKTKEPELKKAEDALEKVEKILGDVTTGYKVQIQRVSPGWCKGFLETIEVIDNQPVDIDYLIRTWGGEVLRLRVKDTNGNYVGGCDVPLYSFPPLHFGKLKQHPADIEAREQQKPPNPLGDIDQVLSIIERLRGKEPQPPAQSPGGGLDLAALGELLMMVRPQQAVQNPLSSIEQIVQAAEAFKTLKGVFGDDRGSSTGENNDMLGQVMNILVAYSKIKSSDDKKPRIAPPNSQQLPNIPPRFIGPVPPNKATPVQVNNGQLNAEQLADMLAALAHQNPEMASNALVLAIDKMPESSRETVLENFYSLFDEDEETFDERENSMNNIHNATNTNGSEDSSRH